MEQAIEKGRRRGGGPKYRTPGLWRASEVYCLLNDLLSLGYDIHAEDEAVRKLERNRLKSWFNYHIERGNIPPGEERTPVRKNGEGGGMFRLYTDAQVRDIQIRMLSIIPPRSGGQEAQL